MSEPGRTHQKRQLRGQLVVLAAGARVRDAEAEIVGHDDGSEPAVLAARVQLKAQRVCEAGSSPAAALE
jgi:methanogenic corrinoid protein MtbC1